MSIIADLMYFLRGWRWPEGVISFSLQLSRLTSWSAHCKTNINVKMHCLVLISGSVSHSAVKNYRAHCNKCWIILLVVYLYEHYVPSPSSGPLLEFEGNEIILFCNFISSSHYLQQTSELGYLWVWV